MSFETSITTLHYISALIATLKMQSDIRQDPHACSACDACIALLEERAERLKVAMRNDINVAFDAMIGG